MSHFLKKFRELACPQIDNFFNHQRQSQYPFTYREIIDCKWPILWLASSKILTPHPPSVCTPAFGAGGGHIRWVERGVGVNILVDARHSSVLYVCRYFVPRHHYPALCVWCRVRCHARMAVWLVFQEENTEEEKNDFTLSLSEISTDQLGNIRLLDIKDDLSGFFSTSDFFFMVPARQAGERVLRGGTTWTN